MKNIKSKATNTAEIENMNEVINTSENQNDSSVGVSHHSDDTNEVVSKEHIPAKVSQWDSVDDDDEKIEVNEYAQSHMGDLIDGKSNNEEDNEYANMHMDGDIQFDCCDDEDEDDDDTSVIFYADVYYSSSKKSGVYVDCSNHAVVVVNDYENIQWNEIIKDLVSIISSCEYNTNSENPINGISVTHHIDQNSFLFDTTKMMFSTVATRLDMLHILSSMYSKKKDASIDFVSIYHNVNHDMSKEKMVKKPKKNQDSFGAFISAFDDNGSSGDSWLFSSDFSTNVYQDGKKKGKKKKK